MTDENLKRVVVESPVHGPAVVAAIAKLEAALNDAEVLAIARTAQIDAAARAYKDAERAAFYEGVREGLRKFAWWKNGTEYVGSCGSTLAAALSHVDGAERKATAAGLDRWHAT